MFPGLFNPKDSEGDESDYEEEDEDDPNSYEESQQKAFNESYGLYHMIVKMADGDLMKVQQLYELPIVAIFNHISYLTAGGYKKQQ